MTDVIIGVAVDMLSDTEIIVVVTPAMAVELIVGISYDIDVLSAVIIGFVTAIDVDMLADAIVNGLPAMMTRLEFTLSSPREGSMPFC